MSDIHPTSASTTVFIEIEKVIEREEFSDYPVRITFSHCLNA